MAQDKCEKCGESLLDTKRSNANWTAYLCVCPKCGHRQSMQAMFGDMRNKAK